MTRSAVWGRARSRPGRTPSILRRIGVVVAGVITAGVLSSFPALADGAPASVPVPLGSVTATGDDQLFGLAADHSAVYRWNGQGTDWTKVGGPAQDLYAGGAGVFATAPDTGKVFKYDGTPEAWSQVGEPGADFAVTNDRLYGLAPDRSAVYEWTGHGTDWVKVGGPAQDLFAGGAGLFATDPNTGTLSKYDGQPDSWTKAGEPGAGFAVSNTHLYGLAPDRSAVLQWTGAGTGWTPLGAPVTAPAPSPVQETPPPTPPQPQDTAPEVPEPQPSVPPASEAPEAAEGPEGSEGSEDSEDSEDSESGDENSATDSGGQREIVPGQVQPAGPFDTAAEDTTRMAVTAQDDLYTLSADNSALWKRGSDGWSPLSGPVNAVYAGRADVFTTGPDSEQIRKYNTGTRNWDPVGGASGQFAATGEHLYRLVPDGIGEWHGDTWTKIGGPAKNIYAGGAGLFATNPDTGDLYKYSGKRDKWTRIGGPGATFAVGEDHVYGIAPDRTAVYEWTGKGTGWTRIGGPAKGLYAGGAGLFATAPGSGNIHKYNGAPDDWTEIGGPGATFAVSDTQLYGLSPDLTTAYRWNGTTGTGVGWTRIGGAADIAQQHQDEQFLAENCEPGRDCVKEYRDAKKLLETSLTDWLKEEGLDILIDTFGIDNIVKCTQGDLFKCLWAAVDAGSTVLGIGAAKKTGKLWGAVTKFTKEYPKFVGEAKQAKKTYDTLRKAIDTARETIGENIPKPDGAESSNSDPEPHSSDDDGSKKECGWVKHGDLDGKNGNRSTGVTACLNQAYLNTHRGTKTDTQRVAPPGYRWAQRTAGFLGAQPVDQNINACHLLAKNLTGSGTALDNLATCARGANDWQAGSQQGDNNMKKYEKDVHKAIKENQEVLYQVTPTYSGRRTVPIGFRMIAYGTKPDGSKGIEINVFVSNTLAGRNLGMFNNQNTNRQVPTGSTS
ncbi:DNA/RNA non-specific endonuclease [Streptomyces sp. NPDC056004]|uniref:DNA/RNA non-specific endonuclease n=1 Tax=Streptomyces sp. NPDC056004 TaxID=3345677 RepID=UPI0035D95AFD